MEGQQPIKFYHDTTCQCCTAQEPCPNTHRTDFVGYEHANKFFNINSPKIKFQDGIAYKISDDICRLQDLVARLMQQQGTNFFLNKYSEECEHCQFLDLNADISEDTLERIIISLQELFTEGEVQVLHYGRMA
jgi:hypothetical protein